MKKCDLCGKYRKEFLTDVGIAMGMGGFDYNFCRTCLTRMTGYMFWKLIFQKDNLKWPPSRKAAQ